MDHVLKLKVWKDKIVDADPAKWCWEVQERGSGRVIACGTTLLESAAHAAARDTIESQSVSPQSGHTRAHRFGQTGQRAAP